MALSMPAGVSYTRCGALPRRGSRVVPLSTMAPASRLLKPSTRVYSSPKPTQPDSNTIGEVSCRPQNATDSDASASGGFASTSMRIDYRASTGVGAVFHVILYEPEIPPNTG